MTDAPAHPRRKPDADDGASLPIETQHAIEDHVLASVNLPNNSFVYFARSGMWVKIGFTSNWRDRLRVLETACPEGITQLVVIRADRSLEGVLHDKFAHLRRHGEWFASDPELDAFLKQIPLEARER